MIVPTRRFGKTELQMPVLTVGGMRYQHSWDDDAETRAAIPNENQINLEATLRHALDLGMNHIETARIYGTSELQLGKILPSIPREKLIVQTKGVPCETDAEFLENFETSMRDLQLDRVDLFSLHGINSEEVLEQSLRHLPVIRQLQKEGRIGHLGFSTHGAPEIIVKAIKTGEFSYVNLHWYFVYHPINWAPVAEAAKHDMGVLVISPNDKGGMLYNPPQILTDLCAPLHPMAFNSLYCLRRPEVHTLSIGAAKPSDFDLHAETVQNMDEKFPSLEPIEKGIAQTMEKNLGAEWANHWHEGLPHQVDTPGEINIPEILRLWTYAKGLDMVEFAKMRYNLLGSAGHWFPGVKATHVDESALKPHLANSRFANEIPDILREAHALLNGEDQKRLSES
jgi:uncharacterized protein